MILVHTLGTALIYAGTCAITPASPRKFALLLYLAAERGRRVPRSTLQELIFPDQAERNARHSLRELFYQLRLMGIDLNAGSDGVGLPAQSVEIDCDSIVATDSVRSDQVHAASGGFLPGFSPTHSEAYTEWYEAYRARSISSLSRVFLKEITRARNAGEWDLTERAARACLAIDVLNEEATLAVAEMLLLAGAKATAVQLLDHYMEDVGNINPNLKIPAKILRRRIDALKPATSSRGTPRFVGRATELSALRGFLQRTLAGEANCVAICGEPGIGKSRLLSEFRSIVELEGVQCEAVGMQPHDSSRPLGAFVDLVPALLKLPGALGCSPASMEALNRVTLRTSGQPLDYRHPHILEAIASSITEAIGDLCEAISTEAPLLLIVEDAHWADQLSRNVLSHLVSSRRDSRILVLLSTREPRAFVRSTRDTVRTHVLPLRPLANETIDSLIANALQLLGCESTPEISSRLSTIAAGNPLFAISLAAHYHDTRDSISIPSTLVDFLGRRLEPLSNVAISVLTTCVVLGKHCTTDRLLRVLQLSTASLLDTVLELADLSLLNSGVAKIAPAHPLVAEVVARRAVPAVWRLVNYGAAEIFENDAVTLDSPTHWWEAATRWREAGETERALSAFRRCAQHAMAIGRPGDAARMLNDALLVPASRELTIAAAKELVIAADLAFEPSQVFRGREVLRTKNYLPEHDEVELAVRQAMFRDTVSTDQVFEETSGCLRCGDASPDHRIEAATLALKCGDLLGDSSRIVTMIQDQVSPEDLLQVSRHAQLQFRLLLKSAQHDRLGAARVASELLEEIEDLPLATRVGPLHDAGTALFLAGELKAALCAWERSFEAACDLKLPTQRVRIAACIAGAYSDLRDDASTALWMSRARDAATEAPELMQFLFLVVQQICRAFECGDIQAAENLLLDAQRSELFSDGATRRRWGRAFELLLRVRQGRLIDADGELARTIFADRVSSISGYRDLEIAAAAEVLMTRDTAEAARLLGAYLTTERDGHRLMDRQLVDVSKRLGLKMSNIGRHENQSAYVARSVEIA